MPTPLPRPGPTDYQDGAGTELDLLWDELCDVVEATEATANAALPATQAAAGTLIAAAADKATPADADSLALSDSAAGGILRRFSWASLKEALNGVFAHLAGVSGGQTLIGGTQASATLTLRSTAHATKGKIIFGSTSAFDEERDRAGIGTTSPAYKLDVIGDACIASTGLVIRNAAATPNWRLSCGGTGAENYTISALIPSEKFLATLDRTGDMGYGTYINLLRTGVVIRPNNDSALNDRISLRVYGGSGITKDLQQWLNTSGSVLCAVDYLGGFGVGTSAPSAKVHVISTAEQLRLGYDAVNYASFTVGSAGALKIAAPLTFRPPASITPAVNGDLTFELTSNTALTIKAKGSDGVVRSATLTLS